MDPLTLESAALSADGRSLVILDQTLLPEIGRAHV